MKLRNFDISDRRSEFIVYVVDDEESIRKVLKEAFKTAGYQVEVFPSGEEALEKVKVSSPHVIFSDIRMPGMSGIQLLEKVKALKPEIEFVLMTSHASLNTAMKAMKDGAYDHVFKPFENFGEVLATADRTVERVYLKSEYAKLADTVDEKEKQKNVIQWIDTFMQKIESANDPEEVIQTFLDSTSKVMGDKPVLFFKFLPQVSSLVAVQATKIPGKLIDSLGVNLDSVDKKELPSLLMSPQKIVPLDELMKEVFKSQNYSALSFMHMKQVFGVFVIFGEIPNEEARRVISTCLQITSVSFDNAMMSRRIKDMSIKDSLTGLYNRRFFNEKLDEEMNRSRRTRYPLSLVYVDLDHFKNYNEKNGYPMGDVLIKAVAQILQKTSRKTDIVARLGGEEFAVLCPYTTKEGAAIKAEKIRLIIEGTKFPHGEKQPSGKFTVSIGVSEYPSVVKDSEALIRSADDCLYQVKKAGRNKVCMAEAPTNFEPDFEALPVPTTLGIPSVGATESPDPKVNKGSGNDESAA